MLEASGPAPVFLDVMGCPPRVQNFPQAALASRKFATDWGTLPTVGIRDLIELKKTQRLADYPIISALSLRLLEETSPSRETLAWAEANLFTLEAFLVFNERYPEWVKGPSAGRPSALTELAGRSAEEMPSETLALATQWMAERMNRLQLADRAYWRAIIAHLRDLRSAGKLAPEGTPV